MTHSRPCLLAATVAAVILSLPAAPAAADSPATAEALAAVQKAVGAGPGLTAIQLTGQSRRIIGEREIGGDFEIAIALPDKFLRVDEMGGSDPGSRVRRYNGFNGAEPLDGMSGGGGLMMRIGPPGAEQNPERMRELQLRQAHRTLARLLVVLVAGSTDTFPLQYTYVGEAVSDEGTADVFEVTGPDDFSVRLFTDKATHLPLMIAYTDVAPIMRTMGPGGPSGRGAGAGQGAHRPSPEELEQRRKEMQAAGPPPLSDMNLYVSDHREVDGVTLPTRVRRAVNGQVNEEWEITGIKVNPSFKADKFAKK
jgi:hypothetical protein